MTGTHSHNQEQHLRLQAITTELGALQTQAEALRLISVEHNHGIDTGANSEVQFYSSSARDMVESLRRLLPELSSLSEDERAQRVESFENEAKRLKSECEKLVLARDAQADRHLKSSLAEGGPIRGPIDAAIVPDTVGELKVQAHMHCHSAEKAEIRSFIGQLQALCDLCMETLCVAAEAAEDAALRPRQ
jgi:hypothetical protein